MKKTVKVLSTAALAATLVVPVAAPAFAATYNGTNVVGVSADAQAHDLGRVYVEFNGSELTSGDYMLVSLPSDFDFNNVPGTATAFGTNGQIGGSQANDTQIQLAAGDNFLTTADMANITIQKIAKNQIKLQFNNVAGSGSENTAKFYLNLKNITVPSGANGEVKATIEGNQGSPFTTGSVTVATASSSGSVSTSIDSVKSITTSTQEIDAIRIKEDRAGAMDASSAGKVKIKLPSGFAWTYKTGSSWNDIPATQGTLPGVVTELSSAIGTNAPIAANKVEFYTEDDGRTLYVVNAGPASGVASYLLLNNLGVKVADENVAKKGDVTATVSTKGNVSSATSELVVARYGDYSTSAYAVGEPKEVKAGATGEKIGKFAIEESVKGSLVPNRDITLTLVGNAKWQSNGGGDFRYDDAETKNKSNILSISNVSNVGSDRKTIKFTLGSTATSDPLKAVFKDAKIDVSPDAEGDIKLVVGGTAGVSGEFVVAKAIKPVEAKVDGNIPTVQIGQQAQAIGDVTITEKAAEAIDKSTSADQVTLVFPQGVTPTLPTSVKVTDGDLTIDESSVTRTFNTSTNKWEVTVKTKSTSTKPSSIKFSGIKVTVDRTVPEGSIKVGVGGNAIVQTASVFPGIDSVTEVEVAKVGTPAAGKGGVGTAVFKLNSKSFTVDGKEVQMDVQPLVKWDRAYVPVRFAANALGVADDNIVWDDKTQTVTIFHNGKVVQMTVGKKEYTVNGVKVAMDVPVFRNKVETNNRTLLPIRYVAQALGVPVNWNKETGEIVLGEQQ